jgi:hypothetical protein
MKLIGIARDLGHAVRTLRREPGFALPAILILGLGLGGTSAVFSLVNGVLLKPLPYAQPDRLVTIREVMPQIAHLYPSLPVNARHFVEWRKECRSLQSMSASLQGETWIDGVSTNGGATPQAQVNVRFVSGDYFRTMGIPLLAGRTLSEGDRGHTRAVIFSRLAASLWPGQDAVGRRFTRGNDQWFEVIGVAGDVRAEAHQAPVAMMYRGYWEWMPYRTVLVARASGAPRSIAGALRAAIHAADPDVPAPPMRTMSEVLDGSVAMRRFQLLLAGGFAVMSLFGGEFRNLRRGVLFRRAAHLRIGNPRGAGGAGGRSVRPDSVAGDGAGRGGIVGSDCRGAGLRQGAEQPSV